MAKKIEIELNVKSKKAVKNLDEMQSEYSQLEKQVDKTSDSQEKLGGVLDSTTGGAITKFKGLKGTLGTVIKSFKSLKVAVMATGIGLLIIAIGALSAMFTSSEKGQNKFSKIMGIIGSVTGNLIDILANLGEKIMWVFTSPREALNSFVELIKSQIINRFNAAIDTVGFLGSAIKKVFEGDFAGAMDAAKSAGSSYVDVLTGVENSIEKVTEGVKGFVKEIITEGKIAGEIADMRAKADKVDRQLLIDRAIANRDRADLLDKAVQKDTFTAKQRIEFLEEAGRIEEEITLKEIAAAKLRYDAKVAENALAGSTKDDLNEEAELKARLIDLEAAKLTKAKLVTTQIFAANAQVRAEAKAVEAEQKAKDDAATKKEEVRLNAIKKVQDDFEAKIKEENAVKESEKIELEKEKRLAELETLEATEAQKADIILFYNDKINKAKEKEGENEKKRDEILQKQKIALISQTFGTLANILGKNSKAGKAFAIAQALTNTYLGVTEVLDNESLLPEPFATIQRVISIAGVLATGFQAVKSIKSVNPSSAGGAVPTSISSRAGAAQSQVPAFNIVGAGATNQLADIIASQEQQPIQTFVVSNDITTAQELDRNIITGASLG